MFAKSVLQQSTFAVLYNTSCCSV